MLDINRAEVRCTWVSSDLESSWHLSKGTKAAVCLAKSGEWSVPSSVEDIRLVWAGQVRLINSVRAALPRCNTRAAVWVERFSARSMGTVLDFCDPRHALQGPIKPNSALLQRGVQSCMSGALH